jgi:hypothetical protein
MKDRILDIVAAVVLAAVFFGLVCYGLGVLIQ